MLLIGRQVGGEGLLVVFLFCSLVVKGGGAFIVVGWTWSVGTSSGGLLDVVGKPQRFIVPVCRHACD